MQSPSFNRHSSGTLEDIAARVVAEFSDQFGDDDVYYIDEEPNRLQQTNDNDNNNSDDEEKEFEFPSLFDRHVEPTEPLVFPIFGRDVIDRTTVARSPLWKLMREEKETASAASCSSSETDDLDGIPEETYCVWTPEAAPGKSRSAGASKRWRIRDLLFRSNSDGKGNFVFLSGGGGKIS